MKKYIFIFISLLSVNLAFADYTDQEIDQKLGTKVDKTEITEIGNIINDLKPKINNNETKNTEQDTKIEENKNKIEENKNKIDLINNEISSLKEKNQQHDEKLANLKQQITESLIGGNNNNPGSSSSGGSSTEAGTIPNPTGPGIDNLYVHEGGTNGYNISSRWIQDRGSVERLDKFNLIRNIDTMWGAMHFDHGIQYLGGKLNQLAIIYGNKIAEIKDQKIGTAKILDGAITGSKIDDEAITESKFADNSVSTRTIKDKSIIESKLADNSVSTRTIIDKAVTESKLADNSVSTRTIQDKAIIESKLADNSVSTRTIIDKAVTTEKINDKAIIESKLADNSISTRTIIDKAVTTEKINDKAVTEIKLADNSVSTRTIIDKAITGNKIADGVIKENHIFDNSITYNKLGKDVQKMMEVTNSGIANAVAVASLPKDLNDNMFNVSAAAGYFNKVGGFAVGITGTIPDRTFIYHANASINTKKQFTVGAGLSYSFGPNKTKNNLDEVTEKMSYLVEKNKEQEKIIRTLVARIEYLELKLTNEKGEKGTKETTYNEKDIIENVSKYSLFGYRSGAYKLTKEQEEILNRSIEVLNKMKNIEILIIGNTDTDGKEGYNDKLGLKRANIVKDFLIKNGLKEFKIEAVSSNGQNDNIAPNTNKKGKHLNRRVDLIIREIIQK